MTKNNIKITNSKIALQMVAVLSALYLASYFSYLLFHSLVEVLSASVAFCIFAISWNARRYIDNNYIIFIGIAYFFIAAIGILHGLTYKGMGIFPDDPNLATQLWLVSRVVLVSSFIIAPFFIDKKLKPYFIFSSYVVVLSLALLSVFYWKNFPTAYNTDTGLTLFKKSSEYVFSILFLASLYLLFRIRKIFDKKVFQLITAALILNILVELIFTLYISVYDNFNLMGHLLMSASIFLTYVGMVEIGLKKPYGLLFKNLKDREMALRESEERYKSLFEMSPDAIIVHIDKIIIYVNQAGIKILGADSKRQIIGQNFLSFIPDNHKEFINNRIKLLYGGLAQTPRSEIKLLRMDRSLIDVEIAGSIINFQNKRAIQSIIRDVSERKEYEEKLKLSAEEWDLTFNSISDMVFIQDKEHRVIKMNDAMVKTLNLDPEKVIGQRCFAFLHQTDGPWPNCPMEKTLADQEPHTEEVNDPGLGVSLLVTTSPIFDERRRLIGAVHISKDITDRKKAENELKEYSRMLEEMNLDSEKFKLGVENAPDSIVITDPSFKIVYANKAAGEITGYEPEGLLGKNFSLYGNDLPQPVEKDSRQITKAYDVLKLEKYFSGEVINIRKNKEKYIADLHISPIFNSRQEIIFYMAVERDITKLKEIDRAKTDFVSLASHQLRTPLSSISLSSELLLRGIAGQVDENQKKYLEEIYVSTQNMSELISVLLNISRLELGTFNIKTEPLEISANIDSLLNEIKIQIDKKGLILEKKLATDLPIIRFDRNILRMLVENLVSNSIRYTPSGGQIVVELFKEKHSIIFKVSDSGCGIPANEKDRIFSKLYRAENAKEISSDGAGLGLYIVKSIVDKIGGKIWFESEEGRGATFYVKIPLK
jgi:PAS domain S-box-containing protein